MANILVFNPVSGKAGDRIKPGCYPLIIPAGLTGIIGTGGEIYFLSAFIAFMGFFKLI